MFDLKNKMFKKCEFMNSKLYIYVTKNLTYLSSPRTYTYTFSVINFLKRKKNPN